MSPSSYNIDSTAPCQDTVALYKIPPSPTSTSQTESAKKATSHNPCRSSPQHSDTGAPLRYFEYNVGGVNLLNDDGDLSATPDFCRHQSPISRKTSLSKSDSEETATHIQRIPKEARKAVLARCSPTHGLPLKVKAQQRSHTCTWEGCDKTFPKPSLLQSHLNVHRLLRPYECTICFAAFTRNHDLRRHNRSVHHIGNIKPFQCQFCPVAFSRNHDLKRHERCVHQVGGKEAHCRRCNKLFTRSDSARFHEKTCGGVGASDSSELSF
ncbi:hypothetical protein BCR33DRAFT_693184 [Rhizoclosmatium globosum]|uniref:C2H2-type domain-containing protein n=1 Tax=Rhizoclosmatium globosum TaxID=329046 RepID=A0A1Y2D371_9FUNG|nr:hypothetical protein BCR33DRAFT_693184 [Rhizoclosmatium globosum]|eukprot:ORY53743.1 hypothetical protein BCR33DRAFT_693184 [Rhizoclosmatium globosum]